MSRPPTWIIILNIVGLLGVAATAVACYLHIPWLGLIGMFMGMIAEAIILGRSMVIHKIFREAIIISIVMAFLVVIIAAILKLADIWIAAVLASYGITFVASWAVTERVKLSRG